MTPINIVVIEGTTRPRRKSYSAAKYIADFGRKLPGVEIVFVQPGDFNLPFDGNDNENRDPKYTKITAKADAFYVMVPEYNHSFPGTLKRLLDSELANYNHKPVALAGSTDGNWGGTRGVESLVPAVREMGLVVTSIDVYFPHVQDIFDGQGNMKPEYVDRYTKNLRRAYDELLWMARALKTAREGQ